MFSTCVGLVGGLITEAMRGHATVNADHFIEDPKWKFLQWLLYVLSRLPIRLHQRWSSEDRIDKTVLSVSECQLKVTDAKYEACCLSSGSWLLLRTLNTGDGNLYECDSDDCICGACLNWDGGSKWNA